MTPKRSGKNHTPLKPPEDSSPTYIEMEYISFRVSKLEDMIKGNVKIDDLVKLENKMASKEDLKGMARKEYLKKLNELMKDIKHSFIPQVSTQEEYKEEKYDLFQSRLEKIEKQLENRKLESSKVDDSLQHHGFNLGPRNYFIPKNDMRKFDGKDPITWIFHIEQFFDLHQVPTLQKVTITSL